MNCAKDKQYCFTRDQTTYIITAYEVNPILYDIKHNDYKNKSKRLYILQNLTDNFNAKNLKQKLALKICICKKINGFRTQYTTEKNKMKKSMVSGAGTDQIYMLSLWCFSLLSFLDKSNPVRKSQSSLIEDLESQESETNFEIVYDGDVGDLNEAAINVIEPELNIDSPLGSPTSMPSIPSRPSTSLSGNIKEKRRKLSKTAETRTEATQILEKDTIALESLNAPAPLITAATQVTLLDAFALSVAAEMLQIKSPSRSRALRQNIMKLIYEAQSKED